VCFIEIKNSFANIFGKSTGIAVKNFAKFGCTITTGEKIIEKHVSELSKNKYIALEFSGNDCDFDWSAISERPDEQHVAKTPISDTEISHKARPFQNLSGAH